MDYYRATRLWRAAACAVLAACFGALTACGGGSHGAGGAIPNPAPSSGTASASNDPDAWTMFRFTNDGSNRNESQTLITQSTVGSLKQSWSWTNPNATAGRGIFAQPIVANSLVYVADMSGYITALSTRTGSQQWQFHPPQADSFVSTPLFYGGYLYAPSVNNQIYVVDASSGTLIRTYAGPTAGGSFQGSPIPINGLVYVGETDLVENPASCITGDQFLAIDPLSNNIVAAKTLTPDGSSGATIWSTPVADSSGFIFAATGNSCNPDLSPYANSVIRFEPRTLAIDWAGQGPPDYPSDADFGASPVLIGGLIVDGAKDGTVYAFDRNSGALAWRSNSGPLAGGSIIGSLATDGNIVVVPFNAGPTPAVGGGIEAFNGSGRLLWSFITGADTPGYGVLSAPVITHSMAFAGYHLANCSSACDVIGALDLQTGNPLWHATIPDWIDGSPTITDDGLFFGTLNNATLYRFTPGGT